MFAIGNFGEVDRVRDPNPVDEPAGERGVSEGFVSAGSGEDGQRRNPRLLVERSDVSSRCANQVSSWAACSRPIASASVSFRLPSWLDSIVSMNRRSNSSHNDLRYGAAAGKAGCRGTAKANQ